MRSRAHARGFSPFSASAVNTDLVEVRCFMNYMWDDFNRSGARPFCFRLTVLPAQSPEPDLRRTYSQTCFTGEACTLECPDANTPAPNTPNMTKNGTVWHKVSNLAGETQTHRSTFVRLIQLKLKNPSFFS